MLSSQLWSKSAATLARSRTGTMVAGRKTPSTARSLTAATRACLATARISLTSRQCHLLEMVVAAWCQVHSRSKSLLEEAGFAQLELATRLLTRSLFFFFLFFSSAWPFTWDHLRQQRTRDQRQTRRSTGMDQTRAAFSVTLQTTCHRGMGGHRTLWTSSPRTMQSGLFRQQCNQLLAR